jgi:amidase
VIPQRGYLDHVGGGLTDADINVFGPIARSARDLDLLLDVLGGPPPEDAVAWRLELPPARFDSPAGLRIGVWFDEAAAPVDREYRALLDAAVDRLADSGARVEVAHPGVTFDEQVALFNAMILPAISPSLDAADQDAASGSHRQWLRLEQQRAVSRRLWADWFDDHDLLLCPVMGLPAFEHDQSGDFVSRRISINAEERAYTDLVAWTGLIGIAGLPSAVPPIGRTEAGIPVGMQVVGAYLRDRDAVAGARIVEDLLGGFTAPPNFT